MKKAKIVLGGIEQMADPVFETLSQSIYASMLGNDYYPTPLPALTVVDEAVNAYSDALVAALQTKGKNEVALKNQARETLTDLLGQLANSVMATANGDRVKLTSSGFPIGKEGETITLLKPENIQITDGVNPGELMVKVKAVKGAKGYAHQYTPDPLTATSEWKQVLSTSCKCTITGLTPGQKYWCRVAAFGAYGQLVYSDVISRVVQ